MPGPKKGTIKLTQEHRDKIAKSKILQRLISHAEGVEDMRQTEVTAAIALLKKVLPDMTESKNESTVTVHHTSEAAGEFTRLVSTVAQRGSADRGAGKPH